jgi:hypothetical protein
MWHCWSQHLEVTSGEWLPDQPVPLLLTQPSAQRWRRWRGGPGGRRLQKGQLLSA